MKRTNIVPKLFVQAICNSSCSFSSTISLVEILLNSLQKGNWNLPASRFNSNHTIGCSNQTSSSIVNTISIKIVKTFNKTVTQLSIVDQQMMGNK